MRKWKVNSLLFLAVVCLSWGMSGAAVAGREVYRIDLSELSALDLNVEANARQAWDTAHLVVSIQGIVNRDAPRLLIRAMPRPDDFWFEQFVAPGAWLDGATVRSVEEPLQLLEIFGDLFNGVVIYSEEPAAASNLASTIAGVEDRLCLRWDPAPESVCQRVLGSGLSFVGDVLDLRPVLAGVGEGLVPGTHLPSSGSAKCDAYQWLKAHYLDTGRCSEEYMANYIDAYWLRHPGISAFSNATLFNHDFFIAQRAFFFDLHVWGDEPPVDDPGQALGTDVQTLHGIMRSMYEQADGEIIQIGGFTPWAWKYTDHGIAGGGHGPVDTEWQYAKIISTYNGIMDADALGFSGMSNASFYQHFPLKPHYPQNPRPTQADWMADGLMDAEGRVAEQIFVCFYMGDYDSAAWLNHHAPILWGDPAHGETLCTWAFNPNLDKRAPHVLDYVRTNQSVNDWFMFGDSGAGYLNPGGLIAPRESGLPDGLDAWVRHNRAYAELYDLSITGFIIDGHSEGMGEAGMDAYLEISPDGIVGQKLPPQGVYKERMPFLRMKLDLYGTPEEAGARVAGLGGVNVPKFLFVRTILQTPSWHGEVMRIAKEHNAKIEFVDPYTFMGLLHAHYEHLRASPLADGGREMIHYRADGAGAGIGLVAVQDGPFALVEHEGAPALRQDPGAGGMFVYCELDDAFVQPYQLGLLEQAIVTLEVWAQEGESVGARIQYDSHLESAYEATPDHWTEPGEAGWKQLRIVLDRPFFGHSQNGGADFRVVNLNRGLLVREVRVERPR